MVDVSKIYLVQTSKIEDGDKNLEWKPCKISELVKEKAFKLIPIDPAYSVKYFNQSYFEFLLYRKIVRLQEE